TAAPGFDDWAEPLVDRFQSTAISAVTVPTNQPVDAGTRLTIGERLSQLGIYFRSFAAGTPFSYRFPRLRVLGLGLLTAAAGGGLRLLLQAAGLRRLRERGTAITDQSLTSLVRRLRAAAGVRRHVALLRSPDYHGPMTAGILRPFIVIPTAFLDALSESEHRG